MKALNINQAWGSLIIEELLRCGAAYFCVAPGSRSSPLSVAVARNPKSKVMVHFDERGLAFHAMGFAAATRKPAVLICTSGTAAANFLPAVIEASKKKIPLIVLSADRPPELRQTGAVQTIDQVGLFGKYATWQTDMPCPDLSIKPEVVLTTIDQAVYQAVRNGGVVHVNCMFREPLAPVAVKTPWGKYFDGIKGWEKSSKPYTQYTGKASAMSTADLKKAAEEIGRIKNGLIVVGKVDGPAQRQKVLDLAKRLGWPVFADVSSGLRLGKNDDSIIHYFDQLLLSDKMRRAIKPDGILHLGGRITSKRYYELVQQRPPAQYIMVLNHGLRNDPLHKVTLRVESTVGNFCGAITTLVKQRRPGKLMQVLGKANAKCDKAVETFYGSQQRLNEPATARLVSQLLPFGTGLYLANSMPIRDMDMYADPKGHEVHVAGNRGASGIDGLIASAGGYAQGLGQPVTLMVGDLSALHDLNSLAMLKDMTQPLVIIIINNGGGGIFSFLPIAEHGDVFEKFFGTPHPFAFANAAAMFEIPYAQPQSRAEFIRAYNHAVESRNSMIIEVMTSRGENVTAHRSFGPFLNKALSNKGF